MEVITSNMTESVVDLFKDMPTAQYRNDAFEQFQTLGLPTKRDEEWKYTDVKAFKKVLPAFTDQTEIQFGNADIVLEKGVIYCAKNLPKGVKLYTLSEALSNVDIAQSAFNNIADNKNEAFTAQNTAFAQHGYVVVVEANAIIEEPINVLYKHDNDGLNVVRNLIVAGKSSSVQIVEQHQNKNTAFTNQFDEIFVEDNACVNYTVIQEETDGLNLVSTKTVNQNRDSRFSSSTISFAGTLIRNNININLNGTNANCDVQGLFLGQNADLLDNHLVVNHNSAHCESNQLYKGILKDKAVGVFNGKIFVEEQAQKTNAFQNNKNILLSDTATINTKPQLEIFADDVKCSHGATSGQLNEDALFYLMARGITKAKAESILTYGFALEVIENIKNESMKAHLDERLIDLLGIRK